jgi:hypothetical protein
VLRIVVVLLLRLRCRLHEDGRNGLAVRRHCLALALIGGRGLGRVLRGGGDLGLLCERRGS